MLPFCPHRWAMVHVLFVISNSYYSPVWSALSVVPSPSTSRKNHNSIWYLPVNYFTVFVFTWKYNCTFNCNFSSWVYSLHTILQSIVRSLPTTWSPSNSYVINWVVSTLIAFILFSNLYHKHHSYLLVTFYIGYTVCWLVLGRNLYCQGPKNPCIF